MKDYNLPDGPSMARSFLGSFKMVNRTIDVISENIDKYGNTYGVQSGPIQHIIITRDSGLNE